MSSPNHAGYFQALATEPADVLREKVIGANPVELLSNRFDKVLEVVEGDDGGMFVRRSYEPGGVSDVLGRLPDFSTAWNHLNMLMDRAEIDVVPSVLIPGADRHPYIIASEYMPDAVNVKDASKETKIETARALGRLFVASGEEGYIPELGMLDHEMFLVETGEDDTSVVKLADVDPRLKPTAGHNDAHAQLFIFGASQLIWKNWSNEDERQDVLKAFVDSVTVDVLDNYPMHGSAGSYLLRAMNKVQGIESDSLNFLDLGD